MQNNLTKKEIDNLYKWGKKYQIKDLDSEEKILNIKELEINYYSNSKKIKYLPKEFFKLTSLESFSIVDCDNIKNIGKLINLKSLEIRSFKIKKLPKEILNLNKLKNIQINHYFDR